MQESSNKTLRVADCLEMSESFQIPQVRVTGNNSMMEIWLSLPCSITINICILSNQSLVRAMSFFSVTKEFVKDFSRLVNYISSFIYIDKPGNGPWHTFTLDRKSIYANLGGMNARDQFISDDLMYVGETSSHSIIVDVNARLHSKCRCVPHKMQNSGFRLRI